MSKVVVIPKDVLNELQRLAVEEVRNEEQHEIARKRYIQAGTDDITTSAKFATRLYEFTLQYAGQPSLITDKLKERGLQFKSTTSIYYHICRLAFAGLSDAEAEKTRMSRYAKVIEHAHVKGLTADAFNKSVASGVLKAFKRLEAATGGANNKIVELGRDAASDYLAKEVYTLGRIDLSEIAEEGDDIQLVAKYEGGKLVVYGLIPPYVSQSETVLQRLGEAMQPDPQARFNFLPEMVKAIKLVTNDKDTEATASFIVNNKSVDFIVSASKGTAILSASSDYDLLGRDVTLPVADWGRILETLIPIRKKLAELSIDGKTLTASVNAREIPHLAKWYEESGKAITTGVADANTLLIEVKLLKSHNELPAGRETELGAFGAKQLETFLKFKPSKKFVAMDLAGNTAKATAAAEAVEDRVNVNKTNFRQLRAGVSKMLRWDDTIAFSKTKDTVIVSADIDDEMTMRLVLGLVR